jgi:hypothetical protein
MHNITGKLIRSLGLILMALTAVFTLAADLLVGGVRSQVE